MIATTESPGLRSRRSTDALVISATTSWPPTSTTTSLITAPGVTCLTLPLSWLRALISMPDLPRHDTGDAAQRQPGGSGMARPFGHDARLRSGPALAGL